MSRISNIVGQLYKGALVGALILAVWPMVATGEGFPESIQAYLKRTIDSRQQPGGMAVGIVDESGPHVIAYGKLANGTDADIDGDTLFEIGSDTKTFTALLLADMVERGQVQLDDPVELYLPRSVTVPARDGKKITLRQLATHTSGLPTVPENLDAKRADNPYADHTDTKLYEFLSEYQLSRDPGSSSKYSNAGMGLLGHALARKAGSDYETLVTERICRPLGMASTCINVPAELKSRLAAGHNKYGDRVSYWDIPTLPGAGALRSTANDLLKYIAAQVGLTSTDLAPAMQMTHDLDLAWFSEHDRNGAPEIIAHGGGTGGFRSFTGFDKSRRRGVVVLSNVAGAGDVDGLGKFLLRSNWRPDVRPAGEDINDDALALYVGKYRRAIEPSPWERNLARLSFGFPKSMVAMIASLCFAAVAMSWWGKSIHRRAIALGCMLTIVVAFVALIVWKPNSAQNALSEPNIGIWVDGNRLLARSMAADKWPAAIILPPAVGELVPQSAERFYERLSGRPVIFKRNSRGVVSGFTAQSASGPCVYEKLSNIRPQSVEQQRTPLVTVTLEPTQLDAFVGVYAFPPDPVVPDGFNLRVWREGQQLVAQADGTSVIQGAFELFPLTESVFLIKLNDVQLEFIKDEKGKAVGVIHREDGAADLEGKRVKEN